MAHSRPLSPWAQRFGHDAGGREDFLGDILHHSGFAPEQPRLHPKYYADKPPPVDSNKTTFQLDLLFSSEKFQRLFFRGLYSWMVGPLMRYVYFSQKTGLISGGHQSADYGPVDPSNAANVANIANIANPENTEDTAPKVVPERREDVALGIFHSERIQVDESKWFSFLKKDRWLEWDRPQPVLGGGNWSVDNPVVWDILSISIELLDRILKALVVDQHVMLQTVLYGMNCAWDQVAQTPEPFEGANLLLSLPYLKRTCDAANVPCPIDFITQFTPRDWVTRLEYLLRGQTWSFIEKYNNDEGIWGVTLASANYMIIVDTGPIRTLMTDDITISERCMIHFMLATTMLHELFHSLFQNRKLDTTWPLDLPEINLVDEMEVPEPLIDNDAATELGYAAEQRIFGGQFIIGPRHCNDLPFGVYIMGWPTPYDASGNQEIIQNDPMFQAGRRLHITRVSALFTSKLLSAEFWDDDTIPQKSANCFNSNRLFISDTVYPGPGNNMAYNRVSLTSDLDIILGDGEPEMIGAWLERRRDWDQRRAGWYREAWEVWQATPWSQIYWRQMILKFGRSFARKNRIECRYIAERLVQWVAWTGDRDMYIQDLPPENQEHDWIFHAVGLLMLAALPIQEDEYEIDEKYQATYRFVPGKETAAALRTPREVYRSRRKDGRWVPTSVLYDPLGRPGQRLEADGFFHEDILDVLTRLIEYLASRDVAVPAPWMREILNTAEDLRRQRRDVRLNARHKRSWAASWRFVIPLYSNTVSRFRNGRWAVQMQARPN
ncbi:hypothetical protein F4859DRAFT_521777 [Xylaria cf. heliscus]|nr:hypothetical protein F4859DRAFT_521777 [Xylaria cf. heliscus]